MEVYRTLFWVSHLECREQPGGVVLHAFNPNTQELETGGSLSSRPYSGFQLTTALSSENADAVIIHFL